MIDTEKIDPNIVKMMSSRLMAVSRDFSPNKKNTLWNELGNPRPSEVSKIANNAALALRPFLKHLQEVLKDEYKK